MKINLDAVKIFYVTNPVNRLNHRDDWTAWMEVGSGQFGSGRFRYSSRGSLSRPIYSTLVHDFPTANSVTHSTGRIKHKNVDDCQDLTAVSSTRYDKITEKTTETHFSASIKKKLDTPQQESR